MERILPEMIGDLVAADQVVLFIDGGAQDPATGRMTRLLDEISVKYQIFDLNADASLRQSLADV